MRDKEQTKAILISAVGEAIAEVGFSRMGVNVIARKAGLDKVLIYRYFGGLDGLYQAYAQSSDFWPSATELLGTDQQKAELISRGYQIALTEFFKRYTLALRSRPLTLEILAWETIERNALTIELEQVREAFGLQMMHELQALELPEADWLAITNLFTGAFAYFAIRARKINHFTGMDLSDEESWDRLNSAVYTLINNLGTTK